MGEDGVGFDAPFSEDLFHGRKGYLLSCPWSNGCLNEDKAVWFYAMRYDIEGFFKGRHFYKAGSDIAEFCF